MTEIKASALSSAHHFDVKRYSDLQRSAEAQSLRDAKKKDKEGDKIAVSQKVDPLTRAAEIVEAHLKEVTGLNKRLTLEVNRDADVVIYKAIDRDTGKVIKQFPPEEMVKMLERHRRAEGLAIDDTV